MSRPAPNEYLTIEVNSAPPQKLKLMLVDGAIRNIQLAKQFWDERQDEAAGERIVRAQEIVAQLLAGLNLHGGDSLVQRVAGVYTFLIRELAQAHLQRSATALDDVLQVLEIERGTWQEVCRRLGTENQSAQTSGPHFGKNAAAELHQGISLEA
jgi:flagellar secretion chaperone FliS